MNGTPNSAYSKIKGRKFLVTGAGRGIGRAVVAELYAKGAIVYALSKNPNNLKSLKDEFPKVIPICVDLSDWDATQKALAPLEAVDCLINNAAIHKADHFLDISSDTFDSLFNVNLKAVINVSQNIAKKMIENGKGGSIVNVSSIAGKKAFSSGIIYSCTKAALEMLTKAMAIELGPHQITVNSVCPAAVDTDMLKGAMEQIFKDVDKATSEKLLAEMLSKTPTRQLYMPMNDVVNTIIFFGSGITSQITGSSVSVDGGFVVA